ncbi:hypothetical protein [Cupriavidus sp. WS]|uniref:hypothetical protein n=1 Tax=Cupriavidus sp. WS TaxID=1312922 RepID=UPI0012DEB8E7|nr:hypothetical protein [Cupriavidus sp. WS]
MSTPGVFRRRDFCRCLPASPALAVPAIGAASDKRVTLLSWGGTIQGTFEKEGWADRFRNGRP